MIIHHNPAYLESSSLRLPTVDGKQSVTELTGSWWAAEGTMDNGDACTIIWMPEDSEDSDPADWEHPDYILYGGEYGRDYRLPDHELASVRLIVE